MASPRHPSDNIRNDLYKHLQKLSISFFHNQQTGDLMTRLSQNVNTIGNLVTADIADILADSFTFVPIVVYLLSADDIFAGKSQV